MELQPRLFNDLPPTREETPVHQLSYPDFAAAGNTMWHGRRRAPGPAWDNTFAKREGWNPEGGDPVHVGTFEAARDRLYPSDYEPTKFTDPSTQDQIQPAVSTPYHYDSKKSGTAVPSGRHDVMERVARPPAYGGTAQMIPFRVRDDAMSNTPDMPVSDAYANLAVDPESFLEGDMGGYGQELIGELAQAGVMSDDPNDWNYDEEEIREFLPAPISEAGGLYYRNTHEDKGSISAVVPSARDLQHWPTEVEKRSKSTWDHRMASFMRGRGY